MSLATEIATIDAETLNYVPLAKSLSSGISAILTNTTLTPLGKALGTVAVIAAGTQSVPNADVEAVGGLAGIVDALLEGFLPQSALVKSATAQTTTTAAPVAAVSAPAVAASGVLADVGAVQSAVVAAPVAAPATEAKPSLGDSIKEHVSALFHPNEASAALAAEKK